ncbi:MAG: ATP-binding cassette domain-containing protein, partial [Hyphomicrobiales bacterium]|nr:ATP-binding cassette domain-containing protein [Hyphomicrobiales bacterium]
MADALLTVGGLSAAYGQASVLFGVSLEARRGEVVALMGRNGAGKTTTLKAIIGMVAASAETLRFDGHDIRGLETFRIARLGL